MNYADRIRSLRQDNDLTQKQVADMLGVAQTTYSQYELEKRPLPIEYLIALCKYYNVSADYMLGFSNIRKPLHKT
ncbi:transcriptional regulator with XRE-family HTH domain [Catenibacillus scindens]|uniref:Transcriptional regulator with XRE-family HTH domain n=1 Tax=Catenibacillus scindens TaxID=673271 RepID=A0A7W8H940_9FIRM|nr:helix-turn-helix transcriptional regulator [Catenibacillus scindens]MBB5264156.1 transcriptional regulator with XRE-family HTH domain [Catenibacillus scindens]